jgi:acyl carrier protein
MEENLNPSQLEILKEVSKIFNEIIGTKPEKQIGFNSRVKNNPSLDTLEIAGNFFESRLVNDLALGSLERMEVIIEIEKKYRIDIPDDKFEEFRTVGDIVLFVEKTKK